METTYMSIDDYGKKCVIHTHTMEYYSAIKKRMKSCHLWQQWWTSGHYAKRNKPDRVKYHMISLVCGNQKRSLLIQRTDWWLPEDRHRRNRWMESGGKNNKIMYSILKWKQNFNMTRWILSSSSCITLSENLISSKHIYYKSIIHIPILFSLSCFHPGSTTYPFQAYCPRISKHGLMTLKEIL